MRAGHTIKRESEGQKQKGSRAPNASITRAPNIKINFAYALNVNDRLGFFHHYHKIKSKLTLYNDQAQTVYITRFSRKYKTKKIYHYSASSPTFSGGMSRSLYCDSVSYLDFSKRVLRTKKVSVILKFTPVKKEGLQATKRYIQREVTFAHMATTTVFKNDYLHIKPIFVVDEGGEKYVVTAMDYLGKDLFHYIKNSNIPHFEDAIKIAKSICKKVNKLHTSNIVHLDIKPENIIVNEGRAYPIDFGLSVGVGESIGPAGTIGYISPQLIYDSYKATDDVPCKPSYDFYSVAQTLALLLLGCKPYAGNSAIDYALFAAENLFENGSNPYQLSPEVYNKIRQLLVDLKSIDRESKDLKTKVSLLEVSEKLSDIAALTLSSSAHDRLYKKPQIHVTPLSMDDYEECAQGKEAQSEEQSSLQADKIAKPATSKGKERSPSEVRRYSSRQDLIQSAGDGEANVEETPATETYPELMQSAGDGETSAKQPSATPVTVEITALSPQAPTPQKEEVKENRAQASEKTVAQSAEKVSAVTAKIQPRRQADLLKTQPKGFRKQAAINRAQPEILKQQLPLAKPRLVKPRLNQTAHLSERTSGSEVSVEVKTRVLDYCNILIAFIQHDYWKSQGKDSLGNIGDNQRPISNYDEAIAFLSSVQKAAENRLNVIDRLTFKGHFFDHFRSGPATTKSVQTFLTILKNTDFHSINMSDWNNIHSLMVDFIGTRKHVDDFAYPNKAARREEIEKELAFAWKRI